MALLSLMELLTNEDGTALIGSSLSRVNIAHTILLVLISCHQGRNILTYAALNKTYCQNET